VSRTLFGLVLSLCGNTSILTGSKELIIAGIYICPQIFIIIILKEKGVMQKSRVAEV